MQPKTTPLTQLAQLTEGPRRVPPPTHPASPDEETDAGPKRIPIDRKSPPDLIEKMRKVDPKTAQRYRQRTGQ